MLFNHSIKPKAKYPAVRSLSLRGRQGKVSLHLSQQAYSLVEICVIVAIVGIMASLAIPAYQNYSIRAKVSEGIKLAKTFQELIGYHHTVTGNFPNNLQTLGYTGNAQSFATNVIKEATVENDGVITITFNESELGGLTAANKNTLIFTPSDERIIDPDDASKFIQDGSITWDCDAALGDGSLPDKYAPSVCRGDDAS